MKYETKIFIAVAIFATFVMVVAAWSSWNNYTNQRRLIDNLIETIKPDRCVETWDAHFLFYSKDNESFRLTLHFQGDTILYENEPIGWGTVI